MRKKETPEAERLVAGLLDSLDEEAATGAGAHRRGESCRVRLAGHLLQSPLNIDRVQGVGIRVVKGVVARDYADQLAEDGNLIA